MEQSASLTIINVFAILAPVIYFIAKESLNNYAKGEEGTDDTTSTPIAEAVDFNERVGIQLNSPQKYEHQVAGHTREVLLCQCEKIFKPMIKPNLFKNEVAVYEYSRLRGDHLGLSLKPFISNYYGCAVRPLSGSEPTHYLELKDITRGFLRPCVCDIKMGTQTYEPNADAKKVQREHVKYAYQNVVGFRITGFKVYNAKQKAYNFVDKSFGRSLAPDAVKAGLAFFFYDGYSMRRDVIMSVIHNLEKLHNWIRCQTQYRFYCSSILIAYESFDYDGYFITPGLRNADIPAHKMMCLNDFIEHCGHLQVKLPCSFAIPCADNMAVRVKLIDFAHTHVLDGKGIDTGYFFGLSSLLTRLYEVIVDIDCKCDPFLPFTKVGYRTPRF